MHHLEQRWNSRNLVDDDPLRRWGGVEDPVQSLRLGGKDTRQLTCPQVKDERVRKALERVRGLAGSAGTEEKRAPRGRRELPDDRRLREDERRHT